MVGSVLPTVVGAPPVAPVLEAATGSEAAVVAWVVASVPECPENHHTPVPATALPMSAITRGRCQEFLVW